MPQILTDMHLHRNHSFLANREVRAEAQNPLQKLLRLNRVIREGHQYRVNPSHPQNSGVAFSSPNTTSIPTSARSTTYNNHNNTRAPDSQVISVSQASSQASPTGFLIPGAGIKLPPENEDDEMLVEDEQDRVFSHRWIQGGVVGVVTVDPTVGGGEAGRGAGGVEGAIMGVRDVMMAEGDVDADHSEDFMGE